MAVHALVAQICNVSADQLDSIFPVVLMHFSYVGLALRRRQSGQRVTLCVDSNNLSRISGHLPAQTHPFLEGGRDNKGGQLRIFMKCVRAKDSA